ncbi:three component ABC system middle component [Aquirhabdus parva]|uniref:Uncharacterized protein n=1 Tax=Aquirhabdus parva TaxID=2283318 RepID=A0A345P8U1_9GAMM|nr:three component ABC system middle component [Aquirhabdus parva]AXI03700.1 hypothetical protein HYN46_13185 [Aquirhabdus parva]
MGLTNAIEHFETLTRSPLVLARIINAFFQHLPNKDKSFLLGYLVLPIVLHPASQDFLRKARKTSSIRTFCNNRELLAGLPQRINAMRVITNLAIQNSLDCEQLKLGPDLSLDFIANKNPESILENQQKAAKNLAFIFEPYDVPAIYKLLGIKEL